MVIMKAKQRGRAREHGGGDCGEAEPLDRSEGEA